MSTNIITGPGSYTTRDGRRAKVMSEYKRDGAAYFYRGVIVTSARHSDVWDYVGWDPSGRRHEARESGQDIVGPWPPVNNQAGKSG